jgi:hypothetical protein
MSRLNWKHILIHFIAFWLIAHAAMILAYLTNVELIEIARTSPDFKKEAVDRNISSVDVANVVVATAIAYLAAKLLAFILAIVICIKRKWFWLNSFIALVLLYILGFFTTSGWDVLKYIFLFPGSFFNGAAFYIINGLIMLLLGLLFLFWKRGIQKPRSTVNIEPNPNYA